MELLSLFIYLFIFILIFTLFYFTILYWFWHTLILGFKPMGILYLSVSLELVHFLEISLYTIMSFVNKDGFVFS